ncbi:MAG: asparagine synthase-related protein [Planctomycetales bacterium]
MSALCGIFNRDGRQDAACQLVPVMNRLASFGRDRSGRWSTDSIALGHQMLHVTPQSLQELQPYFHSESQIAIVSDARLDNREDLFEALAIEPSEQAGIPDSQLILRAYQKWGVDCAPQLLGDFAFAIWDERRRRLFCSRDALGVRPFYYHLAADRFVFASEMSAVRAAMVKPDELDLEFVSAFFRNGQNYPHPERTFYAELLKLKRAHSMVLNVDGIRTWAYWDPHSLTEIRMKSDEDYAEHLNDLLHKAVHARIRTAFPVGAHLSGGLDSSSIAVIAARAEREIGRQLTGYSWAPSPDSLPNQGHNVPSLQMETASDQIEDERRLVEQLGQLENIRIHYSDVDGVDILRQRMCNPGSTHDAEFVHELVVRRQANREGVRVMLSGWGGDELIAFNGRGYFSDLLRRGRWIKMWKELQMRSRVQGDGLLRPFLNKALYPTLPTWFATRFVKRSLFAGWHEGNLPPMLQEDFADRLAAARPLPHKRWRQVPGVRRTQLYLLSREHLPRRIEGWNSGGGRSGLTYAYPLLDRRIVEMSLSVPEEMFFKNGWLRYMFRRSLQGILPDEVRWNINKKEPALNKDRSMSSKKSRDLNLPFWDGLFARSRTYKYMDGQLVHENVLERAAGETDKRLNMAAATYIELLVNGELAADADELLERLQEEQTEVRSKAA